MFQCARSQVEQLPGGCSCSKTHCLKRYCECFSQGFLCNQNCLCTAAKTPPHTTPTARTQFAAFALGSRIEATRSPWITSSTFQSKRLTAGASGLACGVPLLKNKVPAKVLPVLLCRRLVYGKLRVCRVQKRERGKEASVGAHISAIFHDVTAFRMAFACLNVVDLSAAAPIGFTNKHLISLDVTAERAKNLSYASFMMMCFLQYASLALFHADDLQRFTLGGSGCRLVQ